MALAKDLEDALTCPIHLEYYEDPMVLKCLHLLCKKDVDVMTKDCGELTCPVCETVSKRKDIKKDFRTQRLIDVVKADRRKGRLGCQYCQEEAAARKCNNCKMFFCEHCTAGHLRMPASRGHNMVVIKEIVKENKQEVEAAIAHIEKTAAYYEKAKNEWILAKSQNESKLTTIEGQIDHLEDIILAKVRKLQKRLRTELRKEVTNEQERAGSMLKKAEATLEKFHYEINCLKGVIEKESSEMLVDKEKCEMTVQQAYNRCSYLNTTPMPLPVNDIKLSLTWPANEVSNALENIKLSVIKVNRETQKPVQPSSSDEDCLGIDPEMAAALLEKIAQGGYEQNPFGQPPTTTLRSNILFEDSEVD